MRGTFYWRTTSTQNALNLPPKYFGIVDAPCLSGNARESLTPCPPLYITAQGSLIPLSLPHSSKKLLSGNTAQRVQTSVRKASIFFLPRPPAAAVARRRRGLSMLLYLAVAKRVFEETGAHQKMFPFFQGLHTQFQRELLSVKREKSRSIWHQKRFLLLFLIFNAA